MRALAKDEYPECVLVGAAKVPYRLKFVKGKRWLGKCNYKKRTISLSGWLTREQTFMVLWHEVLHAMEYEGNIDLKHKHVYALEEQMYLFMTSNLKVLKFL